MVIDFEATCWDSPTDTRKEQQEIIEIGAAFVTLTEIPEVIHSLGMIIQPALNPTISPFCKKLTGITQNMADNGVSFTFAIDMLDDLIEPADLFCSWGKFDYNILRKDCGRASPKRAYPFDERHLNLKNFMAWKLHCKRKGVSNMLSKLGMEFEGSQHRALADVNNIVRILKSTTFDSGLEAEIANYWSHLKDAARRAAKKVHP